MRALVAFATKDGHTRKIAERIGRVLEQRGLSVDVADLAALPPAFSPESYDAFVVGAPLRIGRHLRPARDFARTHRNLLEQRPSAFFSCSLTTAGKTEQARSDEQRVVDEFSTYTGWKPTQVGIFAGALPYRDYNFFVRFLMRRIAKAAGGDTDTSRNYEYTNWDAVEAFAQTFADRLMELQPARHSAGVPQPPT